MNKQLALFVSQSMSTLLNIQNAKKQAQNTMNKQLALFVSQSMSTLLNIQNTKYKKNKHKMQWTNSWPCFLVNQCLLSWTYKIQNTKNKYKIQNTK